MHLPMDCVHTISLEGCKIAGASSPPPNALREGNSTLTLLNAGTTTENSSEFQGSIKDLLKENKEVKPALSSPLSLQLAPTAHEHVVPSIGAVPVPVM